MNNTYKKIREALVTAKEENKRNEEIMLTMLLGVIDADELDLYVKANGEIIDQVIIPIIEGKLTRQSILN